MITLIQRGGAGLHTVSALLDFCTVEGNLPGYPVFEAGNNLHTQIKTHSKVATEFYDSRMLHVFSDDVLYKDENGKYINLPNRKIEYRNEDITLAPIANDSFGRILILAMAAGKTKNKKLPPDDLYYDYSNCLSLGDQLEKIAFSLRDDILTDFLGFHGHRYPNYSIDVLWFYHNDYQKIINVIVECGWTPKPEKVKEFCRLVLDFNKKYYKMLDNIINTYNQVIDRNTTECYLNFYEAAAIIGLIAAEYNLDTPEKMKLFESIPTNTKEFIDLCQ